MTEEEWLTCIDPGPMLNFLRGKASGRKLRLFACACAYYVQRFDSDPRVRHAIETAENAADGIATPAEITEATTQAEAAYAAESNAHACIRGAAVATLDADPFEAATRSVNWAMDFGADAFGYASEWHYAQLLRDIFGPLFFRPRSLDPDIRAWNDATIPKLAQSAYDDRII